MPPLPIIPDVFRISLVWSLQSGVRPVNVFHVRAPGYTVLDLAEALEETMEATTNSMFGPLSNTYHLETIAVLPLDGTTPTFNYPVELTIAGETSGEILPSTAAVLSITTTQRGPQGRGRVFIGPMGEAGASNGLIDNTPRVNAISGWTEFREDLAGLSNPIQLGVASYVHEDFNPAVATGMRVQVGTIRRRQNQLL